MKKSVIWLQPLRCFIFAMAFLILYCFTQLEMRALGKWWSIIAVIVNIFTMFILSLHCRKQHITYKELIGYKRGNTRVKSVLIMTAVVLIAGMGGMYSAGFLCYGKLPYMDTMMIQPLPVVLSVIIFALLPVTTTFAEDGLYLGAGVNQIRYKWAAIFIPAFFYALQHSFIPVVLDAKYILYRFLSFLPLTILMCWLYYKKRNPVPFMVGHFVINLATVAQIMLTSCSPELFEKIQNM